jgi:rhamnosyltransferase subunit B
LNVLLVAIGSHGDVHPFVGLGLALRARGHHVEILAQGAFESLVTGAGFPFIPFGTADEYRQMALNPDLWHPVRGFKLIVEFGVLPTIQPIYDAVADFWARHPHDETVVVASCLAFGARIAQEKLGLPLVSAHLSPAIFRSVYDDTKFSGMFLPDWLPRPIKRFQYWVGNRTVVNRYGTRPFNAIRAGYGLGPIRNLFGAYMHSPEQVICFWPEWFAPPQPDWPPNVRLTGFPLYDEGDVAPLSADLQRFLEAGDPPIAFTPGSANWQGRHFLTESAEACRLLGRRGILLTRHREHVPDPLPPGVIHVDFAPFSRLLPRCAAVVHHGGIGSAAQGLAAGVPRLAMPMAHDQLDNATRLKRLGVARWVAPKRFRAPRIAEALGELLASPGVRRSCANVAARIRGTDALGSACTLVEQLAGRASPVLAGAGTL